MNDCLLPDFLVNSARLAPDKIALVCGLQQTSYQTLDQQSNALAQALRHYGVKPGDRVLVFMENSPAAVLSFWAILKAGAVVSIINPQTKTAKLAFYLQDTGCHLVLSAAPLLDTLFSAIKQAAQPVRIIADVAVTAPSHQTSTSTTAAAQRPAVIDLADCLVHDLATPLPRLATANSLAAIIYTSGSSGTAKGVMLTHRNMTSAAGAISDYLGHHSEDIILSALPLSFDYGLYQVIMACERGAQLILERSFALLPKLLKRLAACKVTGFPCLPTVAALLASFPDTWRTPVPTLRYITSTGAYLSPTHIQTFTTFFPDSAIFSMYGLTECKRCSYLDPAKLIHKPGSVGQAIPGTELWLVDEHGNRLPAGASGELVIKGPHVMAGYWNNPKATQKRLKIDPLTGERVLYSGDFCRIDAEGDLYFVARKDEIIKANGEKVSLLEVEIALAKTAAIKEAAVIAIEDPISGQACKAFIVLAQRETCDNTHTEQQLRRYWRAHLEPSLIPKAVVFLDALPLSNHGKIDKTRLADH